MQGMGVQRGVNRLRATNHITEGIMMENTNAPVTKPAGAESGLNGGLGITPWDVWVRDAAILSTVVAITGCFIASEMWPAWAVMAVNVWGHYGDAVLKSRRMPNEKLRGRAL